jgi:hypothetical protein
MASFGSGAEGGWDGWKVAGCKDLVISVRRGAEEPSVPGDGQGGEGLLRCEINKAGRPTGGREGDFGYGTHGGERRDDQ